MSEIQTANNMSVRELRLDKITVGTRKRALDMAKVEAMADSIQQNGLLQPIVVNADYRLIAGYHRIEACETLGWTEIPVIVLDIDDLQAKLAEIDENLIRNELSVLEEGEHLVARNEIVVK